MIPRSIDDVAPESLDYTVGWLCATQSEYRAAQACFNDTDKGTRHTAHNGNEYTLGSIGDHHVVACVSVRAQDNGSPSTSAAVTAMLRDFPGIRIGLFTGKGRGAAGGRHNIVPGDIVIGLPGGQKPGVAQFDFNTTVKEQRLSIIKYLKIPPRIVTIASRAVETSHPVDRFNIGTAIAHVLGNESDKTNNNNCIGAIHYGLVASAPGHIESDELRDKIAHEHDILCFETDAAGLPSHLPFVLIRSVTDFRSGKDAVSPLRAAAFGAAYVRAFLLRVRPDDVKKEMAMSKLFGYEPMDLGDSSMRLLRLPKGYGSEIEGELFQTSLIERQSAISYEALSYTWGSNELTDHLVINGKILQITSNLHQALRHLRLQDDDRVIWIDAICIDQGNLNERRHQVKQMGDIYAAADCVLFWLGPTDYETKVVMESLIALQNEARKHACARWKVNDPRWENLWSNVQGDLRLKYDGLQGLQKKGLQLLFERQWWKRLWVIQEVARARAGRICCGTRNVKAQFLAIAAEFISTSSHPSVAAVLDLMPGPSRGTLDLALYSLLLKFRQSLAGEPRDHVYALLGIASDVDHDSDLWQADYSKSVTQLVRDTREFLLSSSFVQQHRQYTAPDIFDLDALYGVYGDGETMAAFLRQLEVKTRLEVAVEHGDVANLETLKSSIGPDVSLNRGLLESAARNERKGKPLMHTLLEQGYTSIDIDESVLVAAAANPVHGVTLTEMLLRQADSSTPITSAVVTAALENIRTGKEVLKLLIMFSNAQQNISSKLIAAIMGYNEAYYLIHMLFHNRNIDIVVDGDVVKAEHEYGFGMLFYLLEMKGRDITITEDAVVKAQKLFEKPTLWRLLKMIHERMMPKGLENSTDSTIM